MSSHVPSLVLSRIAKSALDSYSDQDRHRAYVVLFSLLADPEIDNRTKISLDFFPYAPGTRGFGDGDWFIAYSASESGDVHIHSIHRRLSLSDSS